MCLLRGVPSDIQKIIYRYLFNDVILEISNVVSLFENDGDDYYSILSPISTNVVKAFWMRVPRANNGKYCRESFILFMDRGFPTFKFNTDIGYISIVNGIVYLVYHHASWKSNEYKRMIWEDKQPCWKYAKKLWDDVCD